jgi:CRP-like cAMP-binding protein
MANAPLMRRVSKGFLVKTFLKHNVVFVEGSRGDQAFILMEGEVEISGTVDGRKKVFAVLKPPSIFGEMALFLEDQTRTATAMTLEDTKLVIITRDDLEDYFAKAPQVISSILQVLVSRLKATTKKALKVPNVPLGICRALHLFVLNGHMELGYDSAIRTLADMFVISPAAVENYLGQLAEQGHLNIGAPDHDLTNRVIRINSPDFLENVMKKKD